MAHRGCWRLTEFPWNRSWRAPSFIYAITTSRSHRPGRKYFGSTRRQHRHLCLGRREATRGAEAVSLVRVDGPVRDDILNEIRQIKAITEARIFRIGI